jgi:regulatory protein
LRRGGRLSSFILRPSSFALVPESLRARALRLLARREHTRAELVRKLSEEAGDPAEVERVLDDFERRGWLSERRAVEQRVHALRARYGARRIERDLLARGVSAETVGEALAGLKPGELEAARAVWRRKFGGRLARTPAERAKQARFLQGRGFDLDVVMKVIKADEGE